MLNIRKSQERGSGDYGWLQAKYTFSFSRYFDPKHVGVGDLIVMNEDVIEASQGFGVHPHRDMEIISYVIDGALEHKDSMGNQGVVRPGEVQYMSAGTGVTHSEFNHLSDRSTRMIQIWIKPDKKGYQPNYGQASYKERLRPDELCLIVSGDGRDQSVKINQDASIYTSRLSEGKELSYAYKAGRQGWLQVVNGEVELNGTLMTTGDGVAIRDIENLSIKANSDSEFLLFDLR